MFFSWLGASKHILWRSNCYILSLDGWPWGLWQILLSAPVPNHREWKLHFQHFLQWILPHQVFQFWFVQVLRPTSPLGGSRQSHCTFTFCIILGASIIFYNRTNIMGIRLDIIPSPSSGSVTSVIDSPCHDEILDQEPPAVLFFICQP